MSLKPLSFLSASLRQVPQKASGQCRSHLRACWTLREIPAALVVAIAIGALAIAAARFSSLARPTTRTLRVSKLAMKQGLRKVRYMAAALAVEIALSAVRCDFVSRSEVDDTRACRGHARRLSRDYF